MFDKLLDAYSISSVQTLAKPHKFQDKGMGLPENSNYLIFQYASVKITKIKTAKIN